MKSRGSSKKSTARVGIEESKRAARVAKQSEGSVQDQVSYALSWLKKKSTAQDRDNLARFGITAKKAFGVSMKNVQELAKRLGRSHDLAAALWETGWYEARMLTSFVDEVDRVTPSQMDRWCRDFDNWGICDTLCFFTCSTALRMHGQRLKGGVRAGMSSSNARLLPCSRPSHCTTRHQARARFLRV